jgi:hypothetical protein
MFEVQAGAYLSEAQKKFYNIMNDYDELECLYLVGLASQVLYLLVSPANLRVEHLRA